MRSQCVYAVFKGGVKLWRRLRHMFPRLDGVVDVSWQRGLAKPRVVTLGRALCECEKVILLESSVVSGTTIELILKSELFRKVNVVVVAEHVDFYGAFYTDYVVVDGKLVKVREVHDSYVKLVDGTKLSFAFRKEDFEVVNDDVDILYASVKSWIDGKPLILSKNYVYRLVSCIDNVHERVRRVTELFDSVTVVTAKWRYQVYDLAEHVRRYRPTFTRVAVRCLDYLKRRGLEYPLTFGVAVDDRYVVTIGYSFLYPALYFTKWRMYVTYRDYCAGDCNVIDVVELLRRDDELIDMAQV